MKKSPAVDDATLMYRLVENIDLLTEKEARCFTDMLNTLMRNPGANLTAPQRQWAENSYLMWDLQKQYPSNTNQKMVSAGKRRKKKSDEKENKGPYFWELPENRPLKPPGRK